MAHAIQALLSLYDEAYQRKYPGVKAPIVPGKDAKLASSVLRYSLEQHADFLDAFMRHPDTFIQQSGYTFGVYVSCLGKVIAFAESRKQLQATREKARRILSDAEREHIWRVQRQMEEQARPVPVSPPEAPRPMWDMSDHAHGELMDAMAATKAKLFKL